jgi:MFS family permease
VTDQEGTPDSEPRRALRKLAVVLVAYGLASAALGIIGVVAAVVLYERSGSTAWATVGAVCRVAPFVALSAAAGAFAARRSGRALLRSSALAQVVASLGMLAAVRSAPLLVVAAIAFLAHAAWTVSYPSMAAMVPQLVPEHRLATANGLVSTVESLAWIAGPGLGGAVLAAFGPRAAVAAGAVLALVAAGVWSAVPGVVAPAGLTSDGLLAVIRRGAAELRSPGVSSAVGLQLAANAVMGAVSVLLVIAATDRLGFDEGGYGLLTAAVSVGSFAALLTLRRLESVERPLTFLAASVLFAGAPIAVLALVDAPWPALLLVGASGAGTVLAEVLTLTILQRSLPPGSLAPVLGLLDSITIGTIMVGSLAAGPLVQVFGVERALVVVGAVLPAATVVALPTFRRGRPERIATISIAQLAAAVPVFALARPVGTSTQDRLQWAGAMPPPGDGEAEPVPSLIDEGPEPAVDAADDLSEPDAVAVGEAFGEAFNEGVAHDTVGAVAAAQYDDLATGDEDAGDEDAGAEAVSDRADDEIGRDAADGPAERSADPSNISPDDDATGVSTHASDGSGEPGRTAESPVPGPAVVLSDPFLDVSVSIVEAETPPAGDGALDDPFAAPLAGSRPDVTASDGPSGVLDTFDDVTSVGDEAMQDPADVVPSDGPPSDDEATDASPDAVSFDDVVSVGDDEATDASPDAVSFDDVVSVGDEGLAGGAAGDEGLEVVDDVVSVGDDGLEVVDDVVSVGDEGLEVVDDVVSVGDEGLAGDAADDDGVEVARLGIETSDVPSLDDDDAGAGFDDDDVGVSDAHDLITDELVGALPDDTLHGGEPLEDTLLDDDVLDIE